MHIILQRFCYSPHGTFGHMRLPSGVVLATVERPWADNIPMVSCIPIGDYECGPRPFYRGGYDAVEIKAVPGRSHILMHVANFPEQVNGCIGINSYFGANQGKWCGWRSKDAFNRLMSEVKQQSFDLHITNLVGGTLENPDPETENRMA